MSPTNLGLALLDTEIYQQFEAFAEAFSATNQPTEAIDGADYDLPGTIVYHRAIRKLAEGGRIEVNIVTKPAAEVFEWTHEITLRDKVADKLIHLILLRDGKAVETYGKTVLTISPARAKEILATLNHS